ncbi:MAG: ribosomal protein S18-alanine N-acetyltransferase [Methanobrevibacter sp.]|jgi:ribosomal-protein-alanine N-acetyltransferase|nr:ribosomal protein S18-alanine N-acetyltransferase [Methanobrevibacter sp.]
MFIREFRLKDLETVYKIEKESFDLPYDINILKELYNIGAGFLVSVENDKIIGFIIFWIKDEFLGHIISIAVSEKYQNNGVGRKLLSKAIELFAAFQINKIKLEVKATDLKAINFYKKAGFVETNFLHSYYGKGIDGIRMCLDLQSNL